ncbi:hypothetical protein HNQ96_005825 [Aminobacter lissarensis]|uniref:Uncharacterized protein n=1 Tax=Aminobacter carboxidus TaxID=376165 RepID=A0A8E1WLY6_9HYPH|nr:hypothetical protein [Aminobacter lissarensis]MBB6469931.1 hypothetical protein [Aminobacter lissarensis]
MKSDGFLRQYLAFASDFSPLASFLLKMEDRTMADGPTVVNSGGGGGAGWAVAIIVVIAAVVAFFIFTQGDWGRSSNIDVNVDAPAGSSAPAPAAPEAPSAPAAPAAPAAPGGQ